MDTFKRNGWTNQKIVSSGVFESNDPEYSGKIIIIWYFEEVPEGTIMTVIAENVPPGIRKEDHIIGLGSSLENLANIVKENK